MVLEARSRFWVCSLLPSVTFSRSFPKMQLRNKYVYTKSCIHTNLCLFFYQSQKIFMYIYSIDRVKRHLLNISKIGKIIGMCVYMYVCVHVCMHVWIYLKIDDRWIISASNPAQQDSFSISSLFVTSSWQCKIWLPLSIIYLLTYLILVYEQNSFRIANLCPSEKLIY